MTQIGNLLWERLPAAAGRLSPALSAILTDGRQLRVVPVLGEIAPLLALVTGLVLSASRNIHPGAFFVMDETYASSLPLLITFVAISMLGGALGAWAWFGYVLADLFLVDRFWFATDLPQHLLRERVPQAITYLLLFGMMALLPLAVTVIRTQLARVTALAGARGWLAAGVVQALLSATFVWSWAIAIPALLPVYWMWFGPRPPYQPAIGTPTEFAWLLALVAAVAAAARIAVAAAAERRSLATGPELVSEPVTRLRTVFSVVITTVLLSLALAGLARSLPEALILVGGMLLATVLRSELVPRFTGYVELVSRIPLLVRIAISAATAALIGWALLSTVPGQQTYGLLLGDSYFVLIISIVLSAVVAALLMPSRAGRVPASTTSAHA